MHDLVTADGAVVEDTLDWYAQDADGNIWYLGEETAEYEDGRSSPPRGRGGRRGRRPAGHRRPGRPGARHGLPAGVPRRRGGGRGRRPLGLRAGGGADRAVHRRPAHAGLDPAGARGLGAEVLRPGRRPGAGAAGVRRHQPRGAGGVDPRAADPARSDAARRRRCRGPAGRRAAASGPGGRRPAAPPRCRCRPRRWASARGASCRSPASAKACSPCSRHRRGVRRGSAASPVASASTLAAATASQSTQCMRAPTTGRSSQSSVYGKPSCPSAAQPRAAAASKRATASASSQAGGSASDRAQVQGQPGPLELVPDGDAVRPERVGRPVPVVVGQRLPVGGEVLGQPPVRAPGPSRGRPARWCAAPARAGRPGGRRVAGWQGVRRGQRRLDAVHVGVEPRGSRRAGSTSRSHSSTASPASSSQNRSCQTPTASAQQLRGAAVRAGRRRRRAGEHDEGVHVGGLRVVVRARRASRRARRRAAGPRSAPRRRAGRVRPRPGRPSSCASPKTCVIRATIQVSTGRPAQHPAVVAEVAEAALGQPRPRGEASSRSRSVTRRPPRLALAAGSHRELRVVGGRRVLSEGQRTQRSRDRAAARRCRAGTSTPARRR